MDTRTGMMPVGAVILLSVLTVLSIRAWQGADLASELQHLAHSCSIDSIDRNMAQLREKVRTRLGWESKTATPLPYGAESIEQPIVSDSPFLAYSDDLGLLNELQIGPAQLEPLDFIQKSDLPDLDDGLLAANPMQNVSFARQQEVEESKIRAKSDAPSADEFLIYAPNPQQSESAEQPSRVQDDLSINTRRNRASVEESVKKTSSIPNAFRSASVETEPAYPQWTLPKALINELENFYSHPMTATWAHTTVQILESLTQVRGIEDPDSVVIFNQLARQLEKLEYITIQVSDVPVQTASHAQGELASQLRQVQYSINRRLAIWPILHQLSLQQADESINIASHQVGQYLLASSTRLNAGGIEKGWAEYLQIEKAASAFNSLNPKAYAKKKAARFVLARLFSPSLSQAQQKYLRDTIDQGTVDILRISAIDPVDVGDFAKRLEKLEANDSGANQFYLNDVYQSLFWSDNATKHTLAQQLQTHYRNANFRVSISEQLLNQMIPKLPDTKEPYRDRFMGADVVGQNKISNTLGVNLIPDPNQISMQVVTDGQVKSRTTATRSGIIIENEGNSRFRIIKRLAFGQQGIFAYRPETTSQVAQRVIGLRSNLDNVPAVGWLVRKIAKNKIQEQAPVSHQYAKNQLEAKAEQKFEEEIEQKLTELEGLLTNNLLHPLIAMDLEPDPVQISTTTNRINMRYRLAGRDQMGAHTARPRAVQSCLMSMQIHESVINNFVSRFDLAGKKFTTDELITYINEIMGQEVIAPNSNNSKKNAVLEFAPFDPVRFDFESGKIELSFNLKSFRIGSGKKWRNLTLKATYDTEVVNGFNVALFQGSEKLSIKGRRMNVGDQLAVGLICEVLFPEQLQVALMPKQLGQKLRVSNVQTTQFVVTDGWVGISVDQVSNTNVQPIQQAEQQRQPIFSNLRR